MDHVTHRTEADEQNALDGHASAGSSGGGATAATLLADSFDFNNAVTSVGGSSGNLTILPTTSGLDVTLGGTSTFLDDADLAQFSGFGAGAHYHALARYI